MTEIQQSEEGTNWKLSLRNIPLYVCIYTYICIPHRLTGTENRLVVAKGEEGRERDGLGVWG